MSFRRVIKYQNWCWILLSICYEYINVFSIRLKLIFFFIGQKTTLTNKTLFFSLSTPILIHDPSKWHTAHITEGLLLVTLSSLSRLTKPFANKQINNSYHIHSLHTQVASSPKIQTTLLNKGVFIKVQMAGCNCSCGTSSFTTSSGWLWFYKELQLWFWLYSFLKLMKKSMQESITNLEMEVK